MSQGSGGFNVQTQAISGSGFEATLPGGSNSTGNYISNTAALSTAVVSRTSSTTLTNITGLSVNVIAGATYIIQARIVGTSTTNSGAKFAIGGTATATSISYTGTNYNGTTTNAATTTTTLGNAVGASTAVYTHTLIFGAIVVNAGGTLTVQIAQNASHADATTAAINSTFDLIRVS